MGGSFFLLSFFFTSFPLPPALFFYFRSIDIGLGKKKKKKKKTVTKNFLCQKKIPTSKKEHVVAHSTQQHHATRVKAGRERKDQR